MPLVASTVPNLVSGVSQQPAPSRPRTFGAEMVNAFPSVVSGLNKRPPTEYLATLDPALVDLSDGVAIHTIDRDETEKYIVVVSDGDLAVYDDNGVAQTVTFPDGKAYLPTNFMWRRTRFVTVADTTFILNTNKTTAAVDLAETRTDPTTRASVFIKSAVASTTYAIYVEGVLAASFSTSDNTTAGTALEGTSEIAAGLAADAIVNGYADAEAVGSLVTFGITSGDAIQVDDQFGGNAMSPYTSQIQEFSDLPPTEKVGRLVEVAGNLDERGESYWVRYNSKGVWVEAPGYDKKRGLDASTMPHVLVKTAANTFEFRQAVWGELTVGDDDSNPDPSFVGKGINGMFLFKGRLGFLSEENVILSEVTVLENFYRTTVIQSLASDVIDVASTTGRVSTLYHAASFSDELVLFSDKQQFRLSSGNTLSAETVGITNSTAYPCSTLVTPVTVGSSAYFTADGPSNTLVREIFIDADRQTVEGEDIAVQVPSYIPQNIRGLTASAEADAMVLFSNDDKRSLWLYKWYITENRKVQSAWCRWEFDEGVKIAGAQFLGSYLYIIYKYNDELRLDRMLVGPYIDKELLLDHQITEAQFTSRTYDAGTDLTTIVLPYEFPSALSFYRTDPGSFEEYENRLTQVSDDTYTIVGDVTTHSITAGINYEFLYRYSDQYLREDRPEGESPVQDGRLQLRYFSQVYTDTSYFEVKVTPTGGTTRTLEFNGRIVGDAGNTPDLIPLDSGMFEFPILSKNDEVVVELVNGKPYKCSFGALEWSAMYRPKSRRV